MTDVESAGYVAVARAIATIAHRGQTDKAGVPYIEHPKRVIGYMNNPRNSEIAVAWLHDVLEDSDLTRDDLHAAGIDWLTIADVELLTRHESVSPEDYYEAIACSHTARRVKLADIADNTNPDRVALLDDATIARLTRKYAKARMLLGVAAALPGTSEDAEPGNPTDKENN